MILPIPQGENNLILVLSPELWLVNFFGVNVSGQRPKSFEDHSHDLKVQAIVRQCSCSCPARIWVASIHVVLVLPPLFCILLVYAGLLFFCFEWFN